MVLLYQARNGGGDHTSYVVVRVLVPSVLGGLLGMQCPLSYSIISIYQVDPFRYPADIPEAVRVHRMSLVVRYLAAKGGWGPLGDCRCPGRERREGEEMDVGTWKDAR